MKSALFLVVMLNGGHWIGGQSASLQLEPAIGGPLSDAVVQWQLRCGPATVSAGEAKLADGKAATIELVPPQARVGTEAQWSWTARDAANGALIAEGAESLHLYPHDLLEPLPALLREKTLAVWDRADGLPAVLEREHIRFKRIDSESALGLNTYDVLIVAEDQLSDRPLGQSGLISRVQRGMGALVLRQTKTKASAGYALRPRPAARTLVWRDDQRLLQHLRLRPIAEGTECWALQLPANEPALELVYWPSQVASNEVGPFDALVVNKSIGRGQIICCQVPLGSWTHDPLAQLFLVDAIDQLTGRPAPTPAPSDRLEVLPAVPDTRPQLLPSEQRPTIECNK